MKRKESDLRGIRRIVHWEFGSFVLEILPDMIKSFSLSLSLSPDPDHGFPKEYNHTLEHTELCNSNNFYYAI